MQGLEILTLKRILSRPRDQLAFTSPALLPRLSGHLKSHPMNSLTVGDAGCGLTFSDALASLEPEELKAMAASVPSWAAMVQTVFCW